MLSSTTPGAELLTEQEVADYLRVSVKTVQSWRHRRRGPLYRKIGHLVRYPRAELFRFIEGGEAA